jgi:hypothetical protein
MRGPILALILALLALLPDTGAAQSGAAVLGRVYDAATDASIQNAIVTLRGFGSTLTDSDGRFRFRGVPLGEHTLSVEAFSYAPDTRAIALEGDATVDVALESSPLPLDSIVVEAGTVDYHGRVRDPDRDFLLVDAQVLVRGHEPMWTDAHGRFDLDDLPEGVPVSFSVRAFGYLPIDTTVVPDDGERHDFDLERDAFAEAMIAMQVRRLEERAGGRTAGGWWGVMDRESIVRYTGSHTASTMLQFELPQRILRRVVCTYIDERLIDITPGAMGREIRDVVLTHTLPEEIERVEFLQFYTRSFIMAMATQDVRLRTPTIVQIRQGEYRCL